MSTLDDKKKLLAEQLLRQEGSDQKQLAALIETLHPDQGGDLTGLTRKIGDSVLSLLRDDLGRVGYEEINMKHVLGTGEGKVTPEGMGFRVLKQGDTIIVDPEHISPLHKS